MVVLSLGCQVFFVKHVLPARDLPSLEAVSHRPVGQLQWLEGLRHRRIAETKGFKLEALPRQV